ncbi:site-specific integrase [Bacillus sp. 03113]|uniref:tyrosine-type recombinase/integrase n=1 Tax=Bacillus sp. 03113 TaxID=2578211 RepID=UPI001144BC38|nr:site-specific integrase [Bacillus sp. 03113]
MPYGFIRHIENKGYSQETVTSYEKVLGQFFGYIKSMYPNNKEPYEISPSDIKNYLAFQKKKGKSISTINKELTVIKMLFHFLWEIDKVPVDPAVKLKRFKNNNKPTITIFYEEIESILPKVITNKEYTAQKKAIFLLALKGLKSSEFRFKKENVVYHEHQDYAEIHLKNRVIRLEGNEATIFLEHYLQASTMEGEFVFTTKHHGENLVGPIQVMSILNHLKSISEDYRLPEHLTLVTIRKALAYHLYTKKRYSIQYIAKELGVEENTISLYLKNIMEGILLQKLKEKETDTSIGN